MPCQELGGIHEVKMIGPVLETCYMDLDLEPDGLMPQHAWWCLTSHNAIVTSNIEIFLLVA